MHHFQLTSLGYNVYRKMLIAAISTAVSYTYHILISDCNFLPLFICCIFFFLPSDFENVSVYEELLGSYKYSEIYKWTLNKNILKINKKGSLVDSEESMYASGDKIHCQLSA